ncbi:dimethylargininase [Streptomyces sp. BE303]|uniref:dimethylargininase n=1 Tax=Streptomyces sp. BE303 TaxID=3002528 RepID=UPI002E75AE69|nr:dimethylargininase [Streptomyces sp. BE303]MED7953938.1 arginine deiminase-related protein [Streptomyces sp. BE303]
MSDRVRTPRRRRLLMCPPTYFSVDYAINPWMVPGRPVDRPRAVRQWEALVGVYRSLGHRVEFADPVPGLPDMVFSANAATVVDGRVLVSRFRHPERAPEASAFLSWFTGRAFTEVTTASHINEGQGDILAAGRVLLAGTGFRTEPAAHDEVRRRLGRPVITLRLTDPRFYHLDTALCVLSDTEAAYYPGAFDRAGRAALESLFPDALLATREEAGRFELNAFSDGRHVVLPSTADRLATRLSGRGFDPVGVDMSEFRGAGGGAKCCTLELEADRPGGARDDGARTGRTRPNGTRTDRTRTDATPPGTTRTDAA